MYNNWKDTKALSNKIVILIIVFYRFLTKTPCLLFSNWAWAEMFGEKIVLKTRPDWIICFIFPEQKNKRYDYYRLKTVEENDVNLMGFTIIPCLLYKAARFYWKSICENRTFEFSFTESLFCLYKTIEWD